MRTGSQLETTRDGLPPEQDLVRILEEALAVGREQVQYGRVATYIPELAGAPAGSLGVTVSTARGEQLSAGDCQLRFTVQSISKVFALLLALSRWGYDRVFARVGMEPSGEPFDSILKLEMIAPSKPLNPMINAGAIAVTSLLAEPDAEAGFADVLSFVRRVCNNPTIAVNRVVYESERQTGDRNRALAYFMKGVGVLQGDVEAVLDVYFRQCSIEVTCRDLAELGLFLARDGRLRGQRQPLLDPGLVRLVRTILATCGMYNGSGEFAVRVGMPGKSGVSGGIVVAVPGRLGAGTIGPALDERGNSIGGVYLLQHLSDRLNLSVF